MECVRLGAGREVWGERIGLGIYQSCRNKGSVGHVSVLRWCLGSVYVAWASEGGVMSVCVVSLDYLCR